MFKKLAIAAACSIALYGLAKLINRHIQLVPDRPDPVPTDKLPEAGETVAPENGQPFGGSADPDNTDTGISQTASVQGSEASGEATAVQAREPARKEPCL